MFVDFIHLFIPTALFQNEILKFNNFKVIFVFFFSRFGASDQYFRRLMREALAVTKAL